MLSSIFGSSNANPLEKKPEPSGDLLGSLLGGIAKPAIDTKSSSAPKKPSDSHKQTSTPSANGKSSDHNRDEHRIKKRTDEGDKERSRDAERSRDSHSNRNGKSSGDYDPLGNSSAKKELSKPKLDRKDSYDNITIKKKPADPSRRDDSSPKIKKRESSPTIKRKEPSSLPPKKPEPSLAKKPDTAPTRKPETAPTRKSDTAPTRKPDAAPTRKPDAAPVKRPDTSKSPAPRPSGTSSGNSTSRPPQRPSSSQGSSSQGSSSKDQGSKRPLGPVAAQAKGKELDRKLYPGSAKPQPIGLKPSSNSSSAKPGASSAKPSSGGNGLLSKPSSQRPYSGGSNTGAKPVAKPGSGPSKPSGPSSLVKRPVSGSQPPAKPGMKSGSTGSVPPKTLTGKPLVAAKPGMRREEDRRPSNAPPARPGASNINGKRPNEKGMGSRHEPEVQKKQMLTKAERGHLFKDIFLRGKPKKPVPGGRGGNYSDEDDDYEKDSFIDDGSDPDDEARKELDQMMNLYRNKVKKRKAWEDESSDNMETGFDDLQMEEDYSRYRGRKEDEEQLKFIVAEAETEAKKKKKKKLQID